MARLIVDRTAAWVLSVLGSATVFGAGYGIIHSLVPQRSLGSKVVQDWQEEQEEQEAKRMGRESPMAEGEDQNAKKVPQEYSQTMHRTQWGYMEDNGPARWGGLAPEYLDCIDGRAQSPINLASADYDRALRPLHFSYSKSKVNFVHNGHSLELEVKGSNYISYEGVRYDLSKILLHLPGEHTVDGLPYDMEMQFVHKSKDGKILIASVMMEQAKHSHPILNDFWHGLPTTMDTRGERVSFSPLKLMPATKTYYSYKGSLTQPPCSEGVRWLILTKPISISDKKLDLYNRIIRQNSRPIMPTHGRKVKRSVLR